MIVGITGTIGSGKDTIAKHLVHKGFSHYSLSDEIRHEADKRGLTHSRYDLKELGNELRKEEGEAVLAKKVLKKIKGNAVVTSIRNPEEINELRKHDFVLLAVDARIALRYDRISKRQREGDMISFEEFKAQEEAELKGGQTEQQIQKCMQMADHKIMNEGSVKDLLIKVDEILEL